MSAFTLQPGDEVQYDRHTYRIQAAVSLTTVRIEDCRTGQTRVVPVTALEASDAQTHTSTGDCISHTPDIMQIAEADWAEAKRRAQILAPLATSDICPQSVVQKAAAEIGGSVRHLYTLLRAYRVSRGTLSALVPAKHSGGKGKGRLSADLEAIIETTIQEEYLTPQKRTAQRIVDEVRRRCHRANLQPPADNTVRSRLHALRADDTLRRREGARRARQKFDPVPGTFPPPPWPLAVVQIDHTPVDLIVVDEQDRRPMGRPYLTVAIDVYSRCIPGFCLSLEAPSAVSAGLCIAHAVLEKDAWLAQRHLDGPWPIWGKPDCIHLDNAAEFYSEALRRGCDQHGIDIVHRPIERPPYGGTVERVLGTLMELIHQLPGTTFSNLTERGSYDAEGRAVLTLAELEQWLTIAITQYYHHAWHQGLGGIPLAHYEAAILGTPETPGRGYPPKIRDPHAFLIDFLPVVRRSLQRFGFMLDHITYYSPALRPLLGKQETRTTFLIRRDPRDLSRIYVLDPESQQYLEVPYRTLSRPAITLWEHRHAVQTLRQQGRRQIDEGALFDAIEQMRAITETAATTSKAARRQRERSRQARSARPPAPPPAVVPDHAVPQPAPLARPFEDIELW
jgi:putative transposase